MAEMEITRNERVLDANGMEIGRVIHVIVDGASRQVTDLVVERDGNEVTMPLVSVTRGIGNTLTLMAPAAQAMDGAMFDRAAYHAVDEGQVESMPARPMSGAATLETVTTNSATIMETDGTPQRARATAHTAHTPHAAQPTPVAPSQTNTRQAADRTLREDEEITVPVIEERLTAGVVEREAGRFHLVKTVVQEQQSIDVPLHQEEIYITQTTVARRPATEADLAMLDHDIAVPLHAQEAVVSKEAVVTGEVGIRKEVVSDTQRVTDTVRREEVHVEETGGAHVHTEGATTAPTNANTSTSTNANANKTKNKRRNKNQHR